MHSPIQLRAIKLAILLAIYCNGISAFSPPPSLSCSISSSHTAQQLITTTVHRPSRTKPSVHPSPLLQLHLSSSLQSEIDNDETTSTNSAPTNHDKMKALGNSLILQAALNCGATEPMIDIEWKADRIIVTVDVHKDETYSDDDDGFLMEMGDYLDEDLMDDEIEWDDDREENVVYEDGDEEGEFDDEGFEEEEEFDPEALGLVPDNSSSTDDSNNKKIDLTLIARSINELLAQDGEDSPAFTIAKLHEIEVTTPEFDNILRGRVMFENYKGFDVTVEHWEEPKKKKNKKTKAQKEPPASAEANDEELLPEPKLKMTEGKLVGRDYEKEVTMVNVKGRVVKIKNDKIECVRLPKAKREKGVK